MRADGNSGAAAPFGQRNPLLYRTLRISHNLHHLLSIDMDHNLTDTITATAGDSHDHTFKLYDVTPVQRPVAVSQLSELIFGEIKYPLPASRRVIIC